MHLSEFGSNLLGGVAIVGVFIFLGTVGWIAWHFISPWL